MRYWSRCCRHRVPRKVNRENATRTWHVSHTENAPVSLDAPPGDRQAQPQTASVFSPLSESLKHLLRVAWWQTSAMVLDVDQDAISHRICIEADFAMGMRKLEGVLQEISGRCQDQVPIHIERQQRIDVGNNQLAASYVCFKRCR